MKVQNGVKPFVRKLTGLPPVAFPFHVFAYYERAWLVQRSDSLPRAVYELDARREEVLSSWTVNNYDHPQAIIAAKHGGIEAGLAQVGYQKWEIDPKREIAYALRFEKPPGSELAYSRGFPQIDVVELRTQRLLWSVPCSGVTDIALSPNGQKLYAVRGGYISEELRVHEEECKVLVQIWDTVRRTWAGRFTWGPCLVLFIKGFVLNGRYLALAQAGPGRGVIFLDTRTLTEPAWSLRIDQILDERYDAGAKVYDGIALWGDELYIPVSFRNEKGKMVPLHDRPGRRARSGVAAIDPSRREVTRVLGLSEAFECLTAAVCRGKLFVTSRDGEVFVVDIDAWRKNPHYQPPWVKGKEK